MRIILADTYGMCFGVRDAVSEALEAPYRQELTVLGELVHNPVVLRRLEEAGVRIAGSPDAPVDTPHVMITAHGAAASVVDGLARRGLHVHQATCPLVTHAHRMLDRLIDQGYFPVVIGDPQHVEVKGLVGDLAEYAVLSRPEEISRLAGRPRLGVVSQTTQPLDFVHAMVERIRAAFPAAEVRFADTVCAPTKERQAAARRLAEECDVVVVVGGRTSNNTARLADTCAARGARTYRVESAADLRPDWFTGAETVGITAGTSTLEETVAAVRRRLEEIARTG